MNTLRASEDLTIELVTNTETPHLRLHDASLEGDGECLTGILIWPDEIGNLIDCLATAAGLLAQSVAETIPTRSTNENP